HRLRVVHGDVATLQLDLPGDVQRGRVPDVVGVRLERRTEHRDTLADECAADRLTCQIHRTHSAAHVDGVHLTQEHQRVVGAELTGPGHERPDVLGQAAAAEADTGVEELATDTVVVAERSGRGRRGGSGE